MIKQFYFKQFNWIVWNRTITSHLLAHSLMLNSSIRLIHRTHYKSELEWTWEQLYGHLPLPTKTIQVRRTRQTGHCWRSRDELIRYVLLWTPSHGRAKAGRPARTYILQLCADTRCSLEDLPEAMDDREGWRERVRDIRADSVTWW